MASSEVAPLLRLTDQALEASWGDLEAVFPAFLSLLTSLVLEVSWVEVLPVLQAALDLGVFLEVDLQVA